MKLLNDLLGFAVLTGPLWLILILLSLAIWIAVKAAKHFERHTAKIAVGLLVFLLVFFVPFGDEIAGRIYLSYLCATEASAKVYKTIELPAEYWDEQGRPKFLAPNGFVDMKLLPNRFGWHNIDEPYVDLMIKIEKRRSQFMDKTTQNVLGEKITYMRHFGWINHFSPAPNIGMSCRDLGGEFNRDELFRKEREQDQTFFQSIFKPERKMGTEPGFFRNLQLIRSGCGMPLRARIKIAGIPHHVIQRGNNRSPCFFAEEDYRFYLRCLLQGADRYECVIHAYVLMTNHVHLLISPAGEDALSLMMRYLGSRYVQYVNYAYRRTGTLWEGRFKSSLIDSERYLLTCYRYIELNPVRARMVENPSDYRWSSYGYHAGGHENPMIQDHRLYLELGSSNPQRQHAYRELFRHHLDDRDLAQIRTSVNGGLVLGEERFKDEIEEVVARRVRPGKSGRPKKSAQSGAAS